MAEPSQMLTKNNAMPQRPMLYFPFKPELFMTSFSYPLLALSSNDAGDVECVGWWL
jgi:hypothetical protein